MNNQKIEQLITNIIEEENKNNALYLELNVTTRLKSLLKILKNGAKDYITSTKNILKSIKDEIYYNKNTDACYDYNSRELRILLDSINPKDGVAQYLCTIIKITYHEYKHALLEKILYKDKIESKEDLYSKIANLINYTDGFYLKYHDCFYDEILANKYGFEKTIKLLKEKYPKLYQKVELNLEIEQLLQEIYLANYDVHPFIKKAHADIQKIIPNLDFNSIEKGIGYELIPILYNKDGTYKNLKTLFVDKDWNSLPQEVQYLIISSPSYMEEFDLENSNLEELNFMRNSIDYSIELNQKRLLASEDLRKKLTIYSEKLAPTDQVNIESYVEALLVLNEKTTINTKNLEELTNSRIELIKQIEKQSVKNTKTLTKTK